MAYLEIRQTGPLSGTYRVQGSKNAVLPMLAATLLVPGKTTLHRVPKIKDVNVMLEILHLLGCCSCWEGEALTIDAGNVNNWVIPEELIGQMRSSVILLAPILYRMKKAAVASGGVQLIFTCMSFRRLVSSFIMNGRNTSLHRPIIFAVLIFS